MKRSMKWYLRKLRRPYFDFVFGLANFLFVGDKCPNCGASLKLNNTGWGICDGLYCPKCCLDINKDKRSWTREELLHQTASFSKSVYDDWVLDTTKGLKKYEEQDK